MIANPAWIGANTALAYHTESKDNYYTQEGDLGVWQGKGAEALGFTGVITAKELENALWGKNKEGEQVIQARLDEKGDRKRAAMDLTFNVPKSVSVLYEIANATGNKEFAKKIVEIFNNSVSKSINEFEKIIQTRETEDGKGNTYFSNNIAVAKFTHSVARPVKNEDGNSYTVDPSLHTHAVVMNMTQAKNGEFRALETEEIYREYMKMGSIFRMDIAHELNKQLGLDIKVTNPKQAFFEVPLNSRDDNALLDEFSKRGERLNDEQVIEKLQKKYPNKPLNEIKQLAAYATREWKGEIDRGQIEADNLVRSEGLGFGEKEVTILMERAKENLDHKPIISHEFQFEKAKTLIKDAVEILGEEKSVFTKNDVLEIAGKIGFKETMDMDVIEEAFAQEKSIIKLNKTDNFLSTKEIINAERELIDSVEDTKKIKQKFLVRDAKEAVEEFSKQKQNETGFALTAGQAKAVIHILSNTNQVIGIQGDAGTGKTTALDALNKLKNDSTKLIGLSYTGKAANEIELKTAHASASLFEEAGIESFTISRFLNTNAGNTEKLSDFKDLKIIVDEASMLGTKDAKKLLDKAKEVGAQLIFMGDDKQFKAINAGDPFELLKKHAGMKTIDMKESIRQKDPVLRSVVKKLNAKKMEEGFDQLEKNNLIIENEDGMSALLKEYFKTTDEKLVVAGGADILKDNTILTNTNKVKDSFNDQIHKHFIDTKVVENANKFNVRKSANLRPIEQFFAESYKGATHIYVQKSTGDFAQGSELKIMRINEENDTLLLRDTEGNDKVVDLHKYGRHLQAYKEEEISFGEGERILFTRNQKRGLNVNNGEMGTVRKIDENGNVTIKIDGKKEIDFNISDYNYLDYGYAITTMKSQGLSADNVLAYMDSKSQNSNSFYVAVTRAINSLKIYTNSKEDLRDRVKIEDVKLNATTYLEQIQEVKETRLRSYKETSQKRTTKKEKALIKARALVSKYYLDVNLEKFSEEELKDFVENKGKLLDTTFPKSNRASFLINLDITKLSKGQKNMLGTELASVFNQEKNLSKLVSLWSKMDKIYPLSSKTTGAILDKFSSALGIAEKDKGKEFEAIKNKGFTMLLKGKNDEEAIDFSFLVSKYETLKNTEKTQKELVDTIIKKLENNDFKGASEALQSNKKLFSEKELCQINDKILKVSPKAEKTINVRENEQKNMNRTKGKKDEFKNRER